jgi:hypothetical protein
MSPSPLSPRLLKGAIVTINLATAGRSTIVFNTTQRRSSARWSRNWPAARRGSVRWRCAPPGHRW